VSTLVSDEKAANSAKSRHVTQTPALLVRERRKTLALSQEKAAIRAGISRSEWNQIERGRRGVGPKNAERLARVLGGDASEYLTRPVQSGLVEMFARLTELEKRVDALEHGRPRGKP
jgi:transcriptional regulator with XRE-family HTH domain